MVWRTSNITPAHPHATGVPVYPALFLGRGNDKVKDDCSQVERNFVRESILENKTKNSKMKEKKENHET